MLGSILLLDKGINDRPTTSIYTIDIINKAIAKEPKNNSNQNDTKNQQSIELDSPITSISSISTEDGCRPLSPFSILCSTEISLSEDIDDEHWRHEFLKLMTNLTQYAEGLENMSTELLKVEVQVRELVQLEKALNEKYDQKEQLYLDRLEECDQVSKRQTTLISHLVGLLDEQNIITPSTTQTEAIMATVYRQSLEQSQRDIEENLKYQLIQNNPSMDDKIHSIRWEIGLLIGGNVGTGHVLHAFEGPVDGMEYIITGSGTIANTYKRFMNQSASIQHLIFQRHEYMLHINNHDRKNKFKLLPKSSWTPDCELDQCQFKSCFIKFDFFNRKHHCRRCGILVCQRHSLNRLPLFNTTKDEINKWYRICDSCFYNLIIVKQSEDEDNC